MPWRKWLIRSLVLAATAALGCAGWVLANWTSPALVREQVIAKLQSTFPAVNVSVESARLRLLGHIAMTETRLVRRDDPTRTDFAYIPFARVYQDKEHLIDGRIAFSKVELQRPRLRLVRDKDGRWNWTDMLAPADSHTVLPTLVIEDGTVSLEDRLSCPGQGPIELTGVHLTCINDPVQLVTIEGTGHSEMLGTVKLHATWHRDTQETQVTIQALGVPVTAGLVQRLCRSHAEDGLAGLYLQGTADVHVKLHYQPATTEPLTYDVRCQLQQGKLLHPRLPLPLEGIQVTAHASDGQLTVEQFTARSGAASVDIQGVAALPDVAQTFEGTVHVQHLPISEDLARRLTPGIKKLYDTLQPSGCLSVSLDAARRDNRWERQRWVVQPENANVCYEAFPYLVEGVTGTINVNTLASLYQVELAGRGAGQPVSLQGTWQNAGTAAEVKLDLEATDLPIDKKLLDALPPTVQALAQSFHPAGRVDFQAHIRKTPDQKCFANTYAIRFHDASVKWETFPYPLEGVTGNLDIYPDRWQFRDFRGTHNGGVMQVSCQSAPVAPSGGDQGGSHLIVDIAGWDLGIDADLRAALRPMPGLSKAWDTFGPQGHMNFAAHIDRLPDRPQDLDIAVDMHGCSIKPVFFPYPLKDVAGLFRYSRNQLRLSHFQARHGDTQVSIDEGLVDISPGGGFWADLRNLRGNPVQPDDEFLRALPEALRSGLNVFHLRDRFWLQADRVVVAQDETPGSLPDLWWDGQLWLDKADLEIGVDMNKVTGTLACVGRYDGRQIRGLTGNISLKEATVLKQPFENVHAHIEVKEAAPDVLLVGLTAPLFGGDVSGQVKVDFNSTLRYALDLTASQLDMNRFGRHNIEPHTDLSGLVHGRLVLTGQGGDLNSLDGNGSFHLPSGRLYNVPFLLDLLKVVVSGPDRTFFQEAHAEVSVHGKRVSVGRLDLWGKVVSLWGKGDVNLDGSDVQMDFYPSWGRVEGFLPPVVRDVPPAVSKNLLKIEMRGKLGARPEELTFHKRFVPILIDPLIQLHDQMVGASKK